MGTSECGQKQLVKQLAEVWFYPKTMHHRLHFRQYQYRVLRGCNLQDFQSIVLSEVLRNC